MRRWVIVRYITKSGREGLAVLGAIGDSPSPLLWSTIMYDTQTGEDVLMEDLEDWHYVLCISTIAHKRACWDLVEGLPHTLGRLEAMVLVEGL